MLCCCRRGVTRATARLNLWAARKVADLGDQATNPGRRWYHDRHALLVDDAQRIENFLLPFILPPELSMIEIQ